MSPKKKQKRSDAASDASWKALSFTDVYDFFMSEIEPDLMTTMLPYLDEMYREESAKERKKRGVRYADALKKFHTQFSLMLERWQDSMHDLQEEMVDALKLKALVSDSSALSDIEKQIQNLNES